MSDADADIRDDISELSSVESVSPSPEESDIIDNTRVEIELPTIIGNQKIITSPDVALQLSQEIIKEDPIDIVEILKEIQQSDDIVDKTQIKNEIYKCLGLDTGNNISKLSFNNIDGMAIYENEYQDGMML